MSQQATQTSTAVTHGIRVIVRSRYVAEQSFPMGKRFVFAYTVRIANEGRRVAQLRNRHWIVTDAGGKVEEVRGAGVVGKQPLLGPGEHFEYTSACVLETPTGQMRGTYEMLGSDGQVFDAVIAPFLLAPPYSLN
jgi:ApaG protein